MKNTSHWFLFSILVWAAACISIGYYYDLQPKIFLWQKKDLEEKEIRQVLNQASLLIKQQAFIHKQYELLKQKLNLYQQVDNKPVLTAAIYAVIFQEAEKAGLIIESFNPLSWVTRRNLPMFSLKMVGKGSFNQCIQFMLILTHASIPITLQDFRLVGMENELLLKLEMNLTAYFIPGTVLKLRNLKKSVPFQLTRNPFVAFDKVEMELLSVPLRAIKWVGYISEGNRFWGIVLLPNHKAFNLCPGSIFGLEKAKLIGLDEQAIWLEVNGKAHKRYYDLKEKYGL